MADVKIINTVGANYTATVADVNYTATTSSTSHTAMPSSTDYTATTPIGSHTAAVPEAPIIIANPDQTISLPSSQTQTELLVNTQNLGEENIPDPTRHRVFFENINISLGQINLTLLKPLTSAVILSTSELVQRLIGKNVLDQTTFITEILSKNLQTIFEDSADATDDFYGLANLDDDQIASFNKVAIDYLAGTTDFASYNFVKDLQEQLSIIELNSKIYQKVFTSSLLGTYDDFITTTNFVRVLEDVQLFTDLVNISVQKAFIDSITNIETNQKALASNKLEILTTSDVVTKVVIYLREFLDSLDATDDFYGLANIDDDQIANVSKVLVDITNLVDIDQLTTTSNFIRTFNSSTSLIDNIPIKEVVKGILEQAFSSDLNIKVLNKVIFLQTVATEEISKALNKIFIDLVTKSDYQTILVNKVLITNLSGVSEYNYNELYKIFNTTSNLQDLLQVNIDKVLTTELLTVVEEYRQVFDKALTNTLNSTIDINSKSYTKLLFDQNTSTADESYFTVGKNSVDNISVVATYKFFTISKNLVDQVTVIDTQTYEKQTLWNAFDQADATDDFYGLANIDDDQIASFSKVLASSISGLSDFSNRQIQPNKADNVATTESRSAHIQDYFLEEYVGHTQRYVGTLVTI